MATYTIEKMDATLQDKDQPRIVRRDGLKIGTIAKMQYGWHFILRDGLKQGEFDIRVPSEALEHV